MARPYAGTLTERPLPSVHLQRRSPAPEKGNHHEHSHLDGVGRDCGQGSVQRPRRRAARRADHRRGHRVRQGPRRLQRHDRQAPGGDRALPGHRRRHRLRPVRPRRTAPEIAVRGGGHNAAGLGVCGRRPGHRPVADAQHDRRPDRAHRPRRRRLHLGRRRPRDRGVRHGHPVRVPRVHRRRRPDARRRHRLPVPPLRPHRGQPAVRRRRARRRHLRHRQRRLPPRPVLGAARRRRELRHRHLVHVPLPRHRRARHDHRRPGPVRLRRHRRGDALVPGAAAVAARGAERLDRADHHPARAAVPRGAVGPQGLRHRLVLHRRRTTGPTRCSSRSGRSAHRCWWACSPCRSTCCRARSTALYPAGLQWYWRADFFNEISDAAIDVHVKYGAQLPTGHSTMHMYPIDGAGQPRAARTRRPSPTETAAGPASSWASTPIPANAGRDLAMGQGLLARSCTRPRPAAPTSTS